MTAALNEAIRKESGLPSVFPEIMIDIKGTEVVRDFHTRLAIEEATQGVTVPQAQIRAWVEKLSTTQYQAVPRY